MQTKWHQGAHCWVDAIHDGVERLQEAGVDARKMERQWATIARWAITGDRSSPTCCGHWEVCVYYCSTVCVYYCRTYYKAVCGGGRGTVKDMCYEVRRAEACVD